MKGNQDPKKVSAKASAKKTLKGSKKIGDTKLMISFINQ